MPRAAALILLLLCSFAPAARGEEIVVNFVGDIMLAGSGTATFERLGYDYPFSATAGELRRGDLAVGNLESPIASGGSEFAAKRYRFRAKPAAAPALKRAGFTVLTLANNHMMDYGDGGLRETLEHLDSHGIAYTGAGASLGEARREATVRVKGKRIAFLAYSLTYPEEFFAGNGRAGTAPGYDVHCREDIARARKGADYVVVSFHWGAERADAPKPYQVSAARRAIDAGADVVVGHHPHVLQGIEHYRGGVIFYSLGNFAFGSRSPHADRSIIARVRLGEGVAGVEVVPVNVLHREVQYRPIILKGKRGAEVIARLNRLSGPFGTTVSGTGEIFTIEPAGAGSRIAAR